VSVERESDQTDDGCEAVPSDLKPEIKPNAVAIATDLVRFLSSFPFQ
jgi:hypothetical protein